MGAYASNFQPPSGLRVADFCSPASANWITSHQAATGLPIVVVERLWIRFQQMGASLDGVIAAETFDERAHDPFVRNILNSMRSSDDGSISFQSFLLAAKWLQSHETPVNARLGSMFHLLNGGDPINKATIVKILQRLYPDELQPAIELLASRFLNEMDQQGKGEITEREMVDFCNSLNYESVEAATNFSILSPALKQLLVEASGGSELLDRLASEANVSTLRRARAEPTAVAEPAMARGLELEPNYDSPVDDLPAADKLVGTDLLRQLSERLVLRDWVLLANQLGFLENDLKSLRTEFPDNLVAQINSMLNRWREREGLNATAAALESALIYAGLQDCAVMVQA